MWLQSAAMLESKNSITNRSCSSWCIYRTKLVALILTYSSQYSKRILTCVNMGSIELFTIDGSKHKWKNINTKTETSIRLRLNVLTIRKRVNYKLTSSLDKSRGENNTFVSAIDQLESERTVLLSPLEMCYRTNVVVSVKVLAEGEKNNKRTADSKHSFVKILF